MAYNKKEVQAIRDKRNHPKEKIKCPRCGTYIEIKKINTCRITECQTDGCLRAVEYGI